MMAVCGIPPPLAHSGESGTLHARAIRATIARGWIKVRLRHADPAHEGQARVRKDRTQVHMGRTQYCNLCKYFERIAEDMRNDTSAPIVAFAGYPSRVAQDGMPICKCREFSSVRRIRPRRISWALQRSMRCGKTGMQRLPTPLLLRLLYARGDTIGPRSDGPNV